MEINEILKTMGLSSYEARAYVTLVSLGVAVANEICSKADIPFGRIYEILGSLKEKGLLEVQGSRPKKYLAVEPGIALENLLEKKKAEIEERHRQLITLASLAEVELNKNVKRSESKNTFWNVVLGEEEIHTMLKKKMSEVKEELLMYMELGHHVGGFGKIEEKAMDNFVSLLKKNVEIKILLGAEDLDKIEEYVDPEMLLEMMPFVGGNLNVRIVKEVHVSFDILDKEKVIIKVKNPVSPKNHFAAIFVWDKKLAKDLREKFEALWLNAIPLDIKKLSVCQKDLDMSS